MRLAVVVLLLVLGVTGCGGAHGPENLPPTDDPVAWAGRLCSSLGPLAALRNLRPSFDPNDPATSKESLSRYFEDTRARIGESLQGMEQVGPSPIQGGDELTGKLRGELERLRAAFGDARAKVDAVDPADPVELGARLPAILSGLAVASRDQDLTNLSGNAAVNDAVRQSRSCAVLTGGAPR